ncbi:efflux RND transporter periplasmic adaptor subunit [Zoogloea sp.]|uniref:efflux RND transporter periplasmic adaptor subunit n=1 Tax=Zoogloea sp. TaxID=49181 RepID=UPI0031FDDD5A
MRSLLLSTATLLGSPLVQAAEFVPVTAAQSKALGIVAQGATPPGQALAGALPASIEIPNGQQRVIAAPLAGIVESLETSPGMSVRKGQVLARIASPQALELQRDRIQADAQASLTRQTLQRDEQLFREGLIAESRLQASRANATQAAAQASERRQELSLAQHSGGHTLSLTAPIAGTVLEQLVTVGQRVEQSAPLYRIARLDPLVVDIQVPLSIAARVRVGSPVRIPSTGATGEVIAVGRAVDPASQSVRVRGTINRGADSLRPGQVTAADLVLPEGPKSGTESQVPASAVLHHRDKSWIFVAAREGEATGYRAVPVTVGGRIGDAVLVSGLPAGAQVVTGGVAALKANWLGIGKE